MKCPCGKRICRVTSDNSYFTKHCSHYCWIYYQNPEAYPDIHFNSDHPNLKNHLRRPIIKTNCEMCGDVFSLSHSLKDGNKIFCSRLCSTNLQRCKKKALRDFAILKLIKVHGELGADDIVKLHQNPQRALTTAMVAQILKCNGYITRNIIQLVDNPKGPRIYRYNTNIDAPLGQIIAKKLNYRET